MNKTLLLLAASVLTLGSCSDNKTTDTTTTTTTDATATNASTTDADVQYRSRAQRIADKMAADLKISDTAVVSRIRTTYYNRSRRLGELRNQYTADTAGMAAAMRSVYTETDTEFQGYLPAETYTSYESSRPTYYEDNYMDAGSSADAMSGSSSATDNSASASTMDASAGSTAVDKVKVKRDGDVKVKDTEGNKLKVDGDDGTIKDKPASGGKTKIE